MSKEKSKRLDSILSLYFTSLGTFGVALSDIIGFGAKSLSYNSGKSLARSLTKGMSAGSIEEALRKVSEVFEGAWVVEVFERKHGEKPSDPRGTVYELVFRDCPIRQTCFREGVKQGEVLCYLTHGVIAGAMENLLGKRVELDIEKPGANACLKKLIVFEGG